MLGSTTALAVLAQAGEAPVEALPFGASNPLVTLLGALVVVGLILFIGRYVMSIAWRVVKIAIVIVGLVWLATVLVPAL